MPRTVPNSQLSNLKRGNTVNTGRKPSFAKVFDAVTTTEEREQLVRNTFDRAVDGDNKATEILLHMYFGKPKQSVDIQNSGLLDFLAAVREMKDMGTSDSQQFEIVEGSVIDGSEEGQKEEQEAASSDSETEASAG